MEEAAGPPLTRDQQRRLRQSQAKGRGKGKDKSDEGKDGATGGRGRGKGRGRGNKSKKQVVEDIDGESIGEEDLPEEPCEEKPTRKARSKATPKAKSKPEAPRNVKEKAAPKIPKESNVGPDTGRKRNPRKPKESKDDASSAPPAKRSRKSTQDDGEENVGTRRRKTRAAPGNAIPVDQRDDFKKFFSLQFSCHFLGNWKRFYSQQSCWVVWFDIFKLFQHVGVQVLFWKDTVWKFRKACVCAHVRSMDDTH